MGVADQKKALRAKMLQERSLLDAEGKTKFDAQICHQLETLIEKNNFKIVHAYLPMGDEINITPLLEKLLDKGITVTTPKTLPKRQLENRVLTSLDTIEKGLYGTSHPSNPEVYKGKLDLIIIPGLAYDKNKYRLGYGGGYYDNFLIKHPESLKVGIFYPFQKVDHIPTEEHDLQLDLIL